jgi:hypothetical protein
MAAPRQKEMKDRATVVAITTLAEEEGFKPIAYSTIK